MNIFELYCVFAITTAFAAHLELVSPVLAKQLADTGKLENRWLLSITFFLLNILAAPLVFFSCINPSFGIRFRETLQVALFEENKN